MKTLDLVSIVNKKIAEDIKACEENIKYFPSDNKFAAGISRCLKRIQDILKSDVIKDEPTLKHDVKNPLGATLGYVDMLKTRAENKEDEKAQAENISQSLKNILEKLTKV